MHTCHPKFVTALRALFSRYGMRLEKVDDNAAIPGSYWGAPEAGLVGATVHVRADTPLHSALHEASHAVCMDGDRRESLHTDAGGNYAEEDAVCYLQIVFAQQLDVPINDICADMDSWGYTFRLGSAYAWYTRDAEDARAWLLRHDLITPQATPTWRCRGGERGEYAAVPS